MSGGAVRSGIIGTGFMGRVHANAVRAAGGVVTAVAGSSPQKSEDARRQYGADRALSAHDLIASDEVDLVHICTPNDTHYDLALAAISAGKHVICEKPLAVTAEQASELLAAAEEAGVVHAVPFVYRYYPSVREARERIDSADERVWLIHGHYLQDWLSGSDAYNWRVSAAASGESRAFADIGVHWCDLAEFVTGHRITRVAGSLSRLHDVRRAPGGDERVATEDGATIVFATDRGATGSVVVSQATPGRKNRLWLSVDGENASFVFDQENPDTVWIGGTRGNVIVPKGVETTEFPGVARYVTTPSGHPQGYQDCFNSFVGDVIAAINGDARPGMPTFTDGQWAANLAASVLRASRDDVWVDVSAPGRTDYASRG